MKLIKPSYEILTKLNGEEVLKNIEVAGRVCYKSEDRITEDSAKKFIKTIIESGHHAVLEHQSFSVRFFCDRGVSHEIVRQRLASFCQESTRFCNYLKSKFSSEISVIDISQVMKLQIGKTLTHPINKEKVLITEEIVSLWLDEWYDAMVDAERHYINMTNLCCPAQLSRSVLPNSLKTEIVVTANLREWRTIFTQRCSIAAHPQMKELMVPLLDEIKSKIPVIFDDIYPELSIII